MKNIRRFQRVTFVSFVGLNSIVYTEMAEFPINEQVILIISVVAITTGLVLLSSLFRKKSARNQLNS